MSRPHGIVVSLAVAAVLAYPLAVLARGVPPFPSRRDCVHPALGDGSLEVVFGRFRSQAAASDLLGRVLKAGFQGSQIEPDGCGLEKVAVHGISTLAVGFDVMREARSVGLHPTLEVVTS